MSQVQLAEQLAPYGIEVDPTAITRMERGQRMIRLNEATAIAQVLGISLVPVREGTGWPQEDVKRELERLGGVVDDLTKQIDQALRDESMAQVKVAGLRAWRARLIQQIVALSDEQQDEGEE